MIQILVFLSIARSIHSIRSFPRYLLSCPVLLSVRVGFTDIKMGDLAHRGSSGWLMVSSGSIRHTTIVAEAEQEEWLVELAAQEEEWEESCHHQKTCLLIEYDEVSLVSFCRVLGCLFNRVCWYLSLECWLRKF